jgi:DNA-binding SARP family transcriptional activator
MEHRGRGIRLLGAVTVGTHPVPSVGERTLLAVLAVSAGRRVETDTLVDALWESALPANPRNSLQIHASRLRKRITNEGLEYPLVNERHGYRLNVDPTEVDLHRFCQADIDRPDAVRAALAEWHGEPFGGCVSGSLLDAERVAATDRRLRLRVRHVEDVIAAGGIDEAVGLLHTLREEHPANEAIAQLTMTTLYRAGRQPEALGVFGALRRHLADEFGLDPSQELVVLQRRLLQQDDQLAERPDDRRVPVVLGREDLLAEIAALVGGSGATLVLSGEAGIGKSAVLDAALVAARAAGAVVGRGGWDEDGNPLTGWREALAPLGLGLLAAQAPLVRDGLAELAGRSPVMLALDDVHLADQTSLGVLRHLVRVGVPSHVVLLVAARTPDTRGHPEWERALADLQRSPDVIHRSVDLLDEVAAHELVRRGIRQRPTLPLDSVERLADSAAAIAQGHPLHLTALVDLLADAPDESIAGERLAAAPAALAPLFARHLAMLPADVRRAVEALAVLEPVTLRALATTLGRGTIALAADLDEATRAGVLEASGVDFGFRHALVAAAAREGLTPGLRAALHRERWDCLEEESDAFTRLRHAVGAMDLLPPVEVGRARVHAGLVAYRRGAVAEALVLLDAATSALPPEHADEVTVYRGLALAANGRRDEGDELLDAAVETILSDLSGAPANDRIALAVLAAAGDHRLGPAAAGDRRRLARLRRVRALDLSRSARLDVLGATVAEEARVEGRTLAETASAFEAVLATVRDDDDPALVTRVRMVEALQTVDAPVPAQRRLETAMAARAAAARLGEPLAVLEAEEYVLGAALAAGETARVRVLTEVLEREGERRHRPRSRWASQLVRASTAQAAGEDDAAESFADSALAYGVEWGLPDAHAARLVHRLARCLLVGRLGELGELIGQVAMSYPHMPGWLAAHALVAVQQNDLGAARRTLATYRERRSVVGGGSVDRAGLALAAMAAWVVGDPATAELVRRELPPDPAAMVVVGVGAAVFGPATLATGLAAATLDDNEAAMRDLEHAEQAAGECGWKVWETEARRAGGVVSGNSTSMPLGLG